MKFNFVGGSYESSSKNIDAQRCINWYPEVGQSGTAKGKLVLQDTPGLSTFCTLPTSPVRGLWAGEDRLFAAAGAKLYEIAADGSYEDITIGVTSIANDGTPVSIYPNGTSVFIISAGQAYIHNGVTLSSAPVPADPLATEGAPSEVGTARAGCFLDSYYIASKPDSKVIFFSTPNYIIDDGEYWIPTDYATKEGYPDNIATIVADHEELWIFGSHKSIEVWRNEGDLETTAGFRRDPGAFIHMACPAPYSVVSMDQGLHWLGGDTTGRVTAYRAQGFQPVRVSTHAIEEAWANYSTVSDCYAYTYTKSGHTFWVLNFITGNATWVYDTTTQLWHERAYWNGSSLEKHRGRCHAYTFGKHFIGDHTLGKVYQMTEDAYTDDGTAIHRIRTAPHISDEETNMFHHRLQLDIEVTSSSVPSVDLDWSDDDGANWVTAKTRTPSLNSKKGRLIWNRLGVARDRIYRVSTSSNAKMAIVDAYLKLTPGTS